MAGIGAVCFRSVIFITKVNNSLADLNEKELVMNKIKKVIFDMDGLIFDSERVFMGELAAAAKDYGYNITTESYVKSLGLTGDTLYKLQKEIYGDDYPHYEISRKARDRVDSIAIKGGLPVKSGIRELLEFLSENNIPCVIASSTHVRYVEKYLEASGLRQYFDKIIGGDMVSKSKPEPDIFLAAADDTAPEDCLVLEDSINGITAASRAGIPVVCIPDMVYPADDIKALTAAVVNTAYDVIGLIEKPA